MSFQKIHKCQTQPPPPAHGASRPLKVSCLYRLIVSAAAQGDILPTWIHSEAAQSFTVSTGFLHQRLLFCRARRVVAYSLSVSCT
jgi:hypothetical protein